MVYHARPALHTTRKKDTFEHEIHMGKKIIDLLCSSRWARGCSRLSVGTNNMDNDNPEPMDMEDLDLEVGDEDQQNNGNKGIGNALADPNVDATKSKKICGEEGSGSGLDFGGWKGGGFLNERGEQNLSFIAISETVKRSNFIWHTKEPSGHSGGILMGIDMDIYDIGAIDEGDFYTIFKNTWASAYDNAGGSEEQDDLSILQYADDTLNNSDWKIWMEREAYLSYRGSRENRLLSLINEDGIILHVHLTNSGQFTVQSMYMSIINNGNVAVSVAFHKCLLIYFLIGLRCIDHFHFLSEC
ncbi:hypothetical protein ACJX0J_011676 [Zea mays]